VSEPKIIVWDIETLPNLDKAMDNWCRMREYMTINADMSTMICSGWKVLNSKKTHCINAWDFPSWKKDVNDDKALCEAAYDVLKDADAIITHYGKGFDFKFIQTRLLINGLPTLDPKITHIDTCKIAQQNLKLQSNRLNNIAHELGLGQKLENGGWPLWKRVYQRDPAAQKKMADYCKQDVRLLEKVYHQLKRFDKSILNYSRDSGTFNCTKCGSSNMIKNGFAYTQKYKYRRLQCGDCRAYRRGELIVPNDKG